MNKAFYAGLVVLLLAGGVRAQNNVQPAATPVAPEVAAAPAETGAIKSQNILDVKPDASSEPGYATQTNGERAKVQPGNNAPMWRQVGSGVTGYSSLPAPE